MSGFEVGFARRDITPPLGTPLFGYPSERISNAIGDALCATTLVMRDGEQCSALISLDLCVIDEDEVEALRNAIDARVAIVPANITICATHTHSGPMTINAWGWAKKNHEYWSAIRSLIVSSVEEAYGALQPARLGIGVTTTDIGINRREIRPDGETRLGFNEWGPCDTELTVLRFEGSSGTIAQIVHLAAHPTARGHDMAISRDWPGVMSDRLEVLTSAPVLFINGACGDVAPHTTIGGAIGDGAIAAEEVGLRAAGDAIRAWRSIKEFHKVDLQTLTATMELPFAPLPLPEEVQKQVRTYQGQEHAMGRPGCECNYWNAVQAEYSGTPRTSRQWLQTLTRIGPVVLVPFGGEVFSEIALRLKKASPFTNTLCAGNTNGSHGYYVTREARGRGGYEVWVAKAFSPYLFAENIDDVLVTENLKLLQQLYEA